MQSIPNYRHSLQCRSHAFQDNDECDCTPVIIHRRPGPLGAFTIHSPADYQPQHRSPMAAQ